MLQFITFKFVWFQVTMYVSIHLMLQFIFIVFSKLAPTSSVSIHLMLQFIQRICRNSKKYRVSIHLMLQFIMASRILLPTELHQFQYISCCSLSPGTGSGVCRIRRFQYISCCSLSKPPQVASLTPVCFNTSHVVVYREPQEIAEQALEFQYISCCSLSLSCQISTLCTYVSIHLMLQFIDDPRCIGCENSCVSIHLMLQFILNIIQKVYRFLQFQYISCCSLSREGCCWKIYCRFQYISCCSLSEMERESLQWHPRFNTSHVVVYQC